VAGNPYINIIWGQAAIIVLLLVVAIWTRIYIERMLMPLALEEFAKDPGLNLNEGGLLWTKQHWNLPYSFALFIICTVITMGTVIIRVSVSKYDELLTKLDPHNIELVRQSVGALLSALWFPLLSLSVFMLVSASCPRSSWRATSTTASAPSRSPSRASSAATPSSRSGWHR
jgi:hypothetical protein